MGLYRRDRDRPWIQAWYCSRFEKEQVEERRVRRKRRLDKIEKNLAKELEIKAKENMEIENAQISRVE